MFELVWWFALRDSRVNFRFLRRKSTPFLVSLILISVTFSFYCLFAVGKRLTKSKFRIFCITKFSIDAFNAVFVLPFLVYRSTQTLKKPKNRFRIDERLQSRTLSAALGRSPFGLFQLFVGAFNCFWAVYALANAKRISEFAFVVRVALFALAAVDAFALSLVAGFALFFAVRKGFNAICGALRPQSVLDERLDLSYTAL